MQIRQKIRIRSSTEAIVGGVLGPIAAPTALVLGRRDARGRLRVAGRTTPISKQVRRDLGAVLQAAAAEHPWPEVLPPSRFGQLANEPVAYTRVDPQVVVELSVDTAFEHDRWRHPTIYQRLRLDLRPDDL